MWIRERLSRAPSHDGREARRSLDFFFSSRPVGHLRFAARFSLNVQELRRDSYEITWDLALLFARWMVVFAGCQGEERVTAEAVQFRHLVTI